MNSSYETDNQQGDALVTPSESLPPAPESAPHTGDIPTAATTAQPEENAPTADPTAQPEENAPTADPTAQPAKKRVGGLIAAVVALVVVVAGGVFAYNALAPQASSTTSAANTQSTSSQSSSQNYALADYDATVYDKDGSEIKLTQIANGKPLLINFWATWCPYCVKEMGDYQKLYDEYGNRISFAFIDCVDGKTEKPSDGLAFMEQGGYTLPTYFDVSGEASYIFNAASLPMTVLVRADGQIQSVIPGAITQQSMAKKLESLL